MKRQDLLFWLLAVTAFFALPELATAVFITWALFYFVRCATPEEDRRTVSSLLGYSLAVRIVLFCVLQYFIFSRGVLDIFGDAQDNIIKGMLFGDYFTGKFNIGKVLTIDRYNTHSMSLFNGAYFALFHDDIILLKYINMLAVTAAGWLAYDLLRRAYSSLSGKIAAAIIVFWPTVMIWSITDLKEAHFIFCLVAVFWILNRLGGKMRLPTRIFYMALFFIVLFYTVLLKYKFMFPLLILNAVPLGLYYLLWKNKPERVRGRTVIFGLLLLSVFFLKYHGPVVQKMKDFYSTIFSYYRGSVSTGGWNYSLVPIGSGDMYSFPYFARHLAGGWFHFLTEPLPWHLNSYGLIFMVPVLFLWYTLLFYSFVGLVRLVRLNKVSIFIPMLVFSFLYVTSLGMSVANIGTAVRFRDAIMPVVAMLASCAICLPDSERERL